MKFNSVEPGYTTAAVDRLANLPDLTSPPFPLLRIDGAKLV
ncbi:hypothetical protein J2046_006379 [Rhizobium petrolearium]|nr:hypothetical protein [Neorhizobium petrolearium]MBP1848089.1 hypothetical protein [Neorhizobium petrolearium]